MLRHKGCIRQGFPIPLCSEDFHVSASGMWNYPQEVWPACASCISWSRLLRRDWDHACRAWAQNTKTNEVWKKILSHSQLPGSYPKSLWGSLAPNQSQAMRICWRPCGMGPCPENMIQRKWFHSNFQGLIQNPFGVLQHQIKMRPWESVEDPVEWVPALKIWFKENSFIPTSRAKFKIFLGFGSTKS